MSVMLLSEKSYDIFCESLKWLKHPLVDAEWSRVEQIAKDLYTLNVMSYNEIYKKNNPLPVEYIPKPDQKIGIIPLLKLVQCILYQIELKPKDLETMGKWNLANSLREVQGLENRLTSIIITDLPEYEEAAWGY